jgi:hypothetical protein
MEGHVERLPDGVAVRTLMAVRGGMTVRTESRRVWPPRLVNVFDGGVWRCAQMEAWRVTQLGHQIHIRYRAENYKTGELPLIWVDVARVRPRGERRDTAIH